MYDGELCIYIDSCYHTLILSKRVNNQKPKKILITEPQAYGSPIFKAVQQKRCKALYTALTKSPKSPEYAVGEGSERSNVERSVAVSP